MVILTTPPKIEKKLVRRVLPTWLAMLGGMNVRNIDTVSSVELDLHGLATLCVFVFQGVSLGSIGSWFSCLK